MDIALNVCLNNLKNMMSVQRILGKSLLISTLQAVFEGRRELFEAFTTEYGIEQPQLFATTDWKLTGGPSPRLASAFQSRSAI